MRQNKTIGKQMIFDFLYWVLSNVKCYATLKMLSNVYATQYKTSSEWDFFLKLTYYSLALSDTLLQYFLFILAVKIDNIQYVPLKRQCNSHKWISFDV